MRKMTIGMLAVGAFTASACGNTKTYANKPSPPVPISLSVYINNARVSVSPNSVGAGPIVFTVANHATSAESLRIESAGSSASSGGGQSLANTGPINPEGTAQVTVTFNHPGDYTVSASGTATAASNTAPSSGIQAATVHIGPARSPSNGVLLQP